MTWRARLISAKTLVAGPVGDAGAGAGDTDAGGGRADAGAQGGAVQLDTIKTRVESAPGVCNQRLKLKHDELLSSFAFKFNLRRYTAVSASSRP